MQTAKSGITITMNTTVLTPISHTLSKHRHQTMGQHTAISPAESDPNVTSQWKTAPSTSQIMHPLNAHAVAPPSRALTYEPSPQSLVHHKSHQGVLACWKLHQRPTAHRQPAPRSTQTLVSPAGPARNPASAPPHVLNPPQGLQRRLDVVHATILVVAITAHTPRVDPAPRDQRRRP